MRIDRRKLLRAREQAGWTQTKLGLIAGFKTPAAAVKVVQRGENTGALSATSISKLAAALKKPVEFFVTVEDQKSAPGQDKSQDNLPVSDLVDATVGIADDLPQKAGGPFAALDADIEKNPDNALVRIHHAQALLERTDGDPRERTQLAIDLLDCAIEIAKEMTSDWALAHQLLAKAWFNHPNPQGVDRLSRATLAINQALRYRSQHRKTAKEKNAWGQCLNDSAVILAQSPVEKERRRAVQRFERLAKFQELTDDPHRRAVTFRNIGNTWATIEGENGRSLRKSLKRSIDAYHRALKFHTREAHPVDYARISYSLANSLLSFASLISRPQNRKRVFEAAARAIRAKDGGALSVLTRINNPVDWANAHFNLASIYNRRAEPAADDLKRAITHYGEVLDVFTSEISESEFALTLLPMAEAKEALAALPKQNAAQLLRESIAHMKAVQRVYPADPVHRRALERLRKLYLQVRGDKDPAYSNIRPGLD